MVPVDRAYLAAGFRSKPEWSRPNGAKLAQKPEVAARIYELRNEFKSSAALHVEYLQSLLLPAAEANLADFVSDNDADAGPRFKKLSELTRTQSAAIQAVTFNEDGSIADLKLVPKNEAIKTLMVSIGATGVQRHEHAHAMVGLGDRLDRARERLQKLSFEDTTTLLAAVENMPDGDSQQQTDLDEVR